MESPWKKVPWREGMTLLTAIDAHIAGGPLRLITSGLPELSGKTILERQRCSITGFLLWHSLLLVSLVGVLATFLIGWERAVLRKRHHQGKRESKQVLNQLGVQTRCPWPASHPRGSSESPILGMRTREGQFGKQVGIWLLSPEHVYSHLSVPVMAVFAAALSLSAPLAESGARAPHP